VRVPPLSVGWVFAELCKTLLLCKPHHATKTEADRLGSRCRAPAGLWTLLANRCELKEPSELTAQLAGVRRSEAQYTSLYAYVHGTMVFARSLTTERVFFSTGRAPWALSATHDSPADPDSLAPTHLEDAGEVPLDTIFVRAELVADVDGGYRAGRAWPGDSPVSERRGEEPATLSEQPARRAAPHTVTGLRDGVDEMIGRQGSLIDDDEPGDMGGTGDSEKGNRDQEGRAHQRDDQRQRPFQDGSQLAWPTAGIAARVRAGGRWRYFYLDARHPTAVRSGWWGDASTFYTARELSAAPTLASAPSSVSIEGGDTVPVSVGDRTWMENRLAEWLATAIPPVSWPERGRGNRKGQKR
jgi:hypothetical protein